MPQQTTSEADRRRANHHAQRYARATSPRERAAAAYDQARSNIAQLPNDAARDAAYRRLEQLLTRFADTTRDQRRT
jgi:hypothetical protein